MADDVLRSGVRGISDIITIPGLVNVDFADVRAVMAGAGSSLMGQVRRCGVVHNVTGWRGGGGTGGAKKVSEGPSSLGPGKAVL